MAAQLLALADEAGLQRLKNVCLDYIAHHYSKVASTQASGTSTAGRLMGMIFTEAALVWALLWGGMHGGEAVTSAAGAALIPLLVATWSLAQP